MFLMSGGIDLLLFVKGRNLQEVARFVSSKLANMEGVLSTSTHFMLKTYKDQGVLLEQQDRDERLQVVP
jgi:DNA-binding Lrp family transcriptional regulator